MIVHVCVEFCDKAVIRPRLLGHVGCLPKRSSIKVCFPCSVKGWVKSNVKSLVLMMTCISFFSCNRVSRSGSHKLWAVTWKRGFFNSYQVMLKITKNVFIVVHIQRNKRNPLNERFFSVLMHRTEICWYFSRKTYL